MLEIKLVRCGESYFEAGQFNRWLDGNNRMMLTSEITSAQFWLGDEDVSPEEIALFCGGEIVMLKEVTDDEQ